MLKEPIDGLLIFQNMRIIIIMKLRSTHEQVSKTFSNIILYDLKFKNTVSKRFGAISEHLKYIEPNNKWLFSTYTYTKN